MTMHLTVVFSNNCNLDCSYCCITNKNTSPVLTIEDVFLFIDTYAVKDCTIEFFGGEPTLHYKDIIKVMDYADSLHLNANYRIYTNGLYSKRIQADVVFWKRFNEIILSLDGDFTLNLERTNNELFYNQIIANLKLLISENCNVGVAFVVFTPQQYLYLQDTVTYFKDLGVRYFTYEVVSVWSHDKPVSISKSDMYKVLKSIDSLVQENIYKLELTDTLYNIYSFPREFLSSQHFFVNDNTSCFDSIRALSPRGNIYYCRDLAADEEGLLLKYKPNMIATSETIQSIDMIRLSKESNSFNEHLRFLDQITPCPIKSLQFVDHQELLWWQDEPYSLIMALVFQLSDLTFSNWKHPLNPEVAERYKEIGNKLHQTLILFESFFVQD